MTLFVEEQHLRIRKRTSTPDGSISFLVHRGQRQTGACASGSAWPGRGAHPRPQDQGVDTQACSPGPAADR
jgi:hypothetical protein